jgi:hypothetical protein
VSQRRADERAGVGGIDPDQRVQEFLGVHGGEHVERGLGRPALRGGRIIWLSGLAGSLGEVIEPASLDTVTISARDISA